MRCSSRIYIQIRPGCGPAAGANLLIFCFAPEHFPQTLFSLNLFIFLLFQTFCVCHTDDKENMMMIMIMRGGGGGGGGVDEEGVEDEVDEEEEEEEEEVCFCV